jgi:hypothetical protein
MSRLDRKRVISLSIDLELTIGRQNVQGQARLEELTLSLVELLDQHGVPATWGVSNPALSAATEVIRAARLTHEIAVLGERLWLGDGTTPSRLAREFERRFDGARRAGVEVSTLLLRETPEHLDLNVLLGHGITGVRGPAAAANAEKISHRTGNLRYGIWQVQSPIQVPLLQSWWQAESVPFRQWFRTRGETALHLVLDAGKMVELPDLGLPAVTATMRRLDQLSRHEMVRFATLRELAAEDLHRRTSQPSRSVLAA